MSADRRKPAGGDERRVPYPSWTAIAAEVRRTAGPDGRPGTPPGRQWWDLLAEEPPAIGVDKRDPR